MKVIGTVNNTEVCSNSEMASKFANEPGTLIEYIWGYDKNNNKFKKGIILSAINPFEPTEVMIGFMLTNIKSGDKYDYFDGKRSPGTGLIGAHARALKWANIEWVKYYYPNNTRVTTIPQSMRDTGDIEGIWIEEVKIPISFVRKLRKFLIRCNVYYKDQTLPLWTHHIWNSNNVTM